MAKLSNYASDLLRTLFFRSGAGYTKTAHLYLALFTTAPTAAAGSGVEIATTSGGSSTGYARQDLPPADANWDNSVAGQTSNKVAITFPTALQAWGTIYGW